MATCSQNSEQAIEDFLRIVDELRVFSATQKLPASSSMTSSTGKLYQFLKVSKHHSVLRKLMQSYISLTPHSVKKGIVSTFDFKAKQSVLSREALNSKMRIALSGVGTAFFDPRPSLAKFFEKKERRRKLPDAKLYQDSNGKGQ